MYVLAHLSDPHLGPLPRPRARELAGKRVLGFYNWHRSRKNIHRAEALAAIVADLRAHRPNHIALTGDLTNLSLPAEFEAARAWLDAFGTADEITVVPGNHDYYVQRGEHGPHTLWSDFMRGDEGETFPFLRRRGPLAIVGLSRGGGPPPGNWAGRGGRARAPPRHSWRRACSAGPSSKNSRSCLQALRMKTPFASSSFITRRCARPATASSG
jgi:3',5'-cyclic AMP phosphodiesterase CpdA